MIRISNSHLQSMSTKANKRLLPRKLPAQARSADTVAVILTAAAHILDSSGYGKYSTNAIANRAGVSVGSLYQYFPSKDAITVALIQQEGQRVASSIEKVCLQQIDWQEALRKMIDIAVQHQLSRPQLARILDVEEARLRPRSDTVSIPSHLEEVLRRGLPDVSQSNLQTLAQDIVAMTKGIADVAAEQRKVSQDDLRRRLTSAVFGYLDKVSEWT
jgi:AcrR family transcriptional regulator